jgi:hypothetical protein
LLSIARCAACAVAAIVMLRTRPPAPGTERNPLTQASPRPTFPAASVELHHAATAHGMFDEIGMEALNQDD